MDREKVLKGLKCLTSMSDCTVCPYSYNKQREYCLCDIGRDALTLLKEQEAKSVEIDGQMFSIKYGHCPKCGEVLINDIYPHWCGVCGQAVKWE